MDLTLYYTLQDLDELFDYLNTAQVSDFDRHETLSEEINQVILLLFLHGKLNTHYQFYQLLPDKS
jgi:hypothetical protein